jgi:hypothetical protein
MGAGRGMSGRSGGDEGMLFLRPGGLGGGGGGVRALAASDSGDNGGGGEDGDVVDGDDVGVGGMMGRRPPPRLMMGPGNIVRAVGVDGFQRWGLYKLNPVDHP